MSAQETKSTVTLRVGGFLKVKGTAYEIMEMSKLERTYISQRDRDDEITMYNHLKSVIYLKPPEIGEFDIGDIVTLTEHSVRMREVGDIPNPLTLFIEKKVVKEIYGEPGTKATADPQAESAQPQTAG